VVTNEGDKGDAAGKASLLIFEFEDASGLKVRKEFRLDPESYVITFSATVRQGDGAPLQSVRAVGTACDVGATSVREKLLHRLRAPRRRPVPTARTD